MTQPEGTAATIVGTGEGAPTWVTFATNNFIASSEQK